MSIYEDVMTHDIIYSLLYSPQRIKDKPISEQIVEIKTSKLRWANNKQSFFYVWGWPGPDFNEYTIETYGKDWAFTKEEIIDAWEKEASHDTGRSV